VALDEGVGDAVAFGRPFIAGLAKRFAEKIPLAADDPTTWFSQGIQGYVDYPSDAQ